MIAQGIEDVFRRVTTVDQGFKLQEARTALNCVETPEDGIQEIAVVRVLLEIDQLLGQLFQYFTGLYQKILENLFVSIKRHTVSSIKNQG